MGKPRSPVSQAKTRDRAGDLGRAFDRLRDSLPTYQSGRKKLTKIETLKLAVIYIVDLANLLDDVKKDPSNLDAPDVRLPSRMRKRRCSSGSSTSSSSQDESTPSVDLLQTPVDMQSVSSDQSTETARFAHKASASPDQVQVLTTRENAFCWPPTDFNLKMRQALSASKQRDLLSVASQGFELCAPQFDWSQAYERQTPSGLTDFQMPSFLLNSVI